MGYDARVSFEVALRENVTRSAVERVLQPLLDQVGTTLRITEDPTASKMIAFQHGVVIVSADLQASYSFQDDVFEPVVRGIGELASAPFEAILENHDTGDADERYFRIQAGPAQLIPEFKSQAARNAIVIEDIVLPLSARGWPLEDLATRECITIAAFDRSSNSKDATTRVSVDLGGLDIDDSRRERIARLAVLLAREIAGDELVLHPRPGYGAAEHALDAIGDIRSTIERHEKALVGVGGDSRAPDGSDYVALTDKLTQQIDRVLNAAVARSNIRVEPQTPDQPDAPRG